MLDTTFAALADPTRRAILERLNREEVLSVKEIAQPFAMSLPAVIKHLDVLSDAGLVTRTRTGRTVTCRLEPEPAAEASAWLHGHLRFWERRLDALAAIAEGLDPDRGTS